MRRPLSKESMEPVFPFALSLPARGEGALSHELHRQLRAAIVDGRLKPNSLLPATRRVAASLAIARNTVVRAYDQLIAEGYAIPRRGAKTIVAEVAAKRSARPPNRSSVQESKRLNSTWLATDHVRSSSRSGLPARSFRLGIPEHRHFPHDVWRRLTAQSLRAFARESFNYPPSEGIHSLRESIAHHVAFARAVACAAEDVVVTSGAQQAFDLIARLLVTPGKTRVAVEEPGYPPVRAVFLAAGAQLVPIPVDDEGMCVEELPRDISVISVTPSHQSPTGVALSLRRRTALLAFARQHGAVIVEDDYDGEFRFGGRSLDALQTLDRDALVFYVGTFSKSLFPSLRKGFVVAPRWARDRLVTVKQCVDSHCDALTQAVLAAFIRDGQLARYVRRMRPIYAKRREVLLEGLHGKLRKWLEPIPAEAGLHLAARIRSPHLAAKIIPKVRQFMPGAQSTAEYALRPLDRPAVAFGYGVIEASEIARAVSRLQQALTSIR